MPIMLRIMKIKIFEVLMFIFIFVTAGKKFVCVSFITIIQNLLGGM